MKRTMLAIFLGLLMIATGFANFATAQSFGGSGEIEAGVNSGYDGGPVDITLYHHIFNLLDDSPMITAPMDPNAPDIAQGRSLPYSDSPAHEQGAGSASNPAEKFMFASPGIVHWNTSLDKPRIHPERGLGYDMLLNQDNEIIVYWYMSADALETTAESPTKIGAMPQLQVTATLRLGDDIAKDLTQGETVASGTTTVDMLTNTPEQVPAGNSGPMEIKINLGKPSLDRIPAEEAYNLQVKWRQVEQSGVEYTDRQWNLHTGVEHPNRMVWSVENPIRLNYVHPQPIGENKMAIHSAFITPFGNYDIDLNNLSMSVTDPNGETVIAYENSQLRQGSNVQGPIVVQKTWQHNSHYEPVLITWVWNFRQADAQPGDYTITVTGSNLQGNAIAEKTASFTVPEQGAATGVSSEGQTVEATNASSSEENGSPLGLVPVLAGLAGALAVAGLRKRRD